PDLNYSSAMRESKAYAQFSFDMKRMTLILSVFISFSREFARWSLSRQAGNGDCTSGGVKPYWWRATVSMFELSKSGGSKWHTMMIR
ncbi:MAG: hypothetical protein ACREA9_15680, partial [Pyrinomonadaceae bacterium]